MTGQCKSYAPISTIGFIRKWVSFCNRAPSSATPATTFITSRSFCATIREPFHLRREKYQVRFRFATLIRHIEVACEASKHARKVAVLVATEQRRIC